MGFQTQDLAYHITTHLRLNAVYWGLTALCIMGRKDALDREELIEFVMSCWDEDSGLHLFFVKFETFQPTRGGTAKVDSARTLNTMRTS